MVIKRVGNNYGVQNRHQDSEPYLRSMVAMTERDHKDDQELAGALAGLGYSLAQQKRYAESEPFFQRAIAIIEKAKGPADLFLAQLLSYQAGVLNGLGRPADAEPLVHRALAIVEKASGATIER
jgi:tetratricopeptide (TPR) repeat protein